MMKRAPSGPTAHYPIAVADLADCEPPGIDVHLEALPELPADLGQLAGPLHADVHIELRGPHLLLHADVDGELRLVCHRCLVEFPYHTDLAIDEHMVVEDDQSLETIEWELDTVTESIPPDGTIDLVDWLRQHIILNLPSRQLCDSACTVPPTAAKGESNGDPRWASLQRLQDQQQGDDHGST